MAEGLNKAILIGNVGQEPELRYTQSGTAVMTLRIATNERMKKDGEWVDHAEWHSVVIWGKRAEGLNKFLAKGHQVCVEGRIQTRKWENRDGITKYSTEIVASNVLVLGGRRGEGGGGGGDQADQPADDGFEDDIPF